MTLPYGPSEPRTSAVNISLVSMRDSRVFSYSIGRLARVSSWKVGGAEMTFSSSRACSTSFSASSTSVGVF